MHRRLNSKGWGKEVNLRQLAEVRYPLATRAQLGNRWIFENSIVEKKRTGVRRHAWFPTHPSWREHL